MPQESKAFAPGRRDAFNFSRLFQDNICHKHSLTSHPPDIYRIVICPKSDKQKFWVDISVIEQFSTKSCNIEIEMSIESQLHCSPHA